PPLPPVLFAHVTCVTATLSAAVPEIVSDETFVAYVAPDVGPVMVTAGGEVSGALNVTVSVAVAALFAASRAVTAMTLVPGCNTIPLADHVVVPDAIPEPPRSLAHVTCVTPTLSDDV